MKINTLSRRLIATTVATVWLLGCSSTQGQVENTRLSAYITPKDQVLSYKEFFEKVKLAIDQNRLDEPLYLEQLLEMKIRGAKPLAYIAEPAEFPPGLIIYYVADAAPNPPAFKYRSRRIMISNPYIAACIKFEFIEAIFGKGFSTPPYGQPHIYWPPGAVPPIPTGTYAGMIGIFKEVGSSPVTDVTLEFSFDCCLVGMTIHQAKN